MTRSALYRRTAYAQSGEITKQPKLWLRDNMLEGVIRHQFQGPPAGIVLREDWLVMVL